MSSEGPEGRKGFTPYHTVAHYLFGANLMAACAQLVLGVGALALIYAAGRLLLR